MSRAQFEEVYTRQLQIAIREHPDEYAYNVREVPTVVARMMVAIEHGSYNKDSRALKATCRELHIKHTYTAIAEYMLS